MFVLIDTRRKKHHIKNIIHTKQPTLGCPPPPDDQRYKTPALFELYFVLKESDCIHILVDDHNNIYSYILALLLLYYYYYY